jgi:hypothetical protein
MVDKVVVAATIGDEAELATVVTSLAEEVPVVSMIAQLGAAGEAQTHRGAEGSREQEVCREAQDA